jgi:hypothetical protein
LFILQIEAYKGRKTKKPVKIPDETESRSSSPDIEIIEVPPRIFELIDVMDSDDEESKIEGENDDSGDKKPEGCAQTLSVTPRSWKKVKFHKVIALSLPR